jgi:hypothetical protein
MISIATPLIVQWQCQLTYPEVNFKIPASTELSVADLVRDRHLVVLVQRFVEAFAHVGFHLDVVRGGRGEDAARRSEQSEYGKQHGDWVLCLPDVVEFGVSR